MPEIAEFKIALADITPEIWRRVVVPASISLAGLHTVIQATMGWENSQLHMFMVGGHRYGIPEDDDWDNGRKLLEEADHRLGDLVTAGDWFLYVYDFGDDWRHEISVEALRPLGKNEAVPAVFAGQYACPPEDCGGPFSYPEMLEVLRNPGHEDHEHYIDWIDAFDAEAFDLGLAKNRLRARAPPSGFGH